MSRDVWEFDPTEAGNNVILPADGGMPEGVLRDDVNLGHRELMGSFRRYAHAPEWIRPRLQGPTASEQGVFSWVNATTFQINLAGVDLTPYFNEGRILKIVDGVSAGVDLTTQVEGTATYSNPLTTVTIKSTDSMASGASDVYSFFSEIVRALALQDSDAQFYIPATADSAGINAAIVAADAAGGGTVLLTEAVYTADAQISFSGTIGRVRLFGAGPEVILREPSGTPIDPLVVISGATEAVHIENVQFDKQTNGQTGTILRIDSGLRPRVKNCIFTGGTDSIEIAPANTLNVVLTDNLITLFDHHGIVTNSASGTSSGIIANNRIQGSGIVTADPAGIKVSGQWTIEGNVVTSMNSASLNVRGIWLWNEAANNGGRRSVISGNRVDGDGGTQGSMIEIGGDFVTCIGNRINGPTAGRGIYVNGTQAGQTIEHVSITGNTVVRGTPIETNLRTAHVVISGNHCEPEGSALPGMIIDSADSLVSGNSVSGGSIGISVASNATETSVMSNHVGGALIGIQADGAADVKILQNTISGTANTGISLTGALSDARVNDNVVDAASTTGISVGASVTNAWLQRNDTTGATGSDISDSGTSTNRWHNSFDVNEVSGFVELDNTSINYNTITPQDFGPTAISLPCGGKAGRYAFTISFREDLTSTTAPGVFDVGIMAGPNGTDTDPFLVSKNISRLNWPIAEKGSVWLQFEAVVDSDDTLFCAGHDYTDGSGGSGFADRALIQVAARKIGME